MTLEEVIDATLMGADADETLDQLRDRIANAVRGFLGSDEVVAAGREAILENLRDRRLLKWLFAEDPETHGAIGYVDGPIDAETQNEWFNGISGCGATKSPHRKTVRSGLKGADRDQR